MSSTHPVAHEEISPALLVDAMFAFRKTAAIKAAIEFDLFTKLGAEGRTATILASELGCAERGVRILCDFLVVSGFLTKSGETYGLTPSSQIFLDRRSPAYMGAAIDFLASPQMVSLFLDDPAAYVRNGGSVGLANVAPDNPVWVKFARAMGAFTGASAKALASDVATWSKPPSKVLDIAAGPGAFGIEIAKVSPSASVVALDWKPVLAVTEENATNAGVAARFTFQPGSAFEVDWGSGYDLILLPNFLHHFDVDGCITLLKKARASLVRCDCRVRSERGSCVARISGCLCHGHAGDDAEGRRLHRAGACRYGQVSRFSSRRYETAATITGEPDLPGVTTPRRNIALRRAPSHSFPAPLRWR